MNAGKSVRREGAGKRSLGAIVRKLFLSLSLFLFVGEFAYEMRFYRKLSRSLLKGGKSSKV